MSTEDYLKQICLATANEVKMGLALKLINRYQERDGEFHSEDKIAAIVAGVVNRVFGELPANDFQRDNEDHMTMCGQELALDCDLCEVLSGAAYCLGYFNYIIAGGSRGMFSNHFLTYIRSCNDPSLGELRAKARLKILKFGDRILAPLDAMQELHIYRKLGNNPNEREFYEAAHRFAVAEGIPFG